MEFLGFGYAGNSECELLKIFLLINANYYQLYFGGHRTAIDVCVRKVLGIAAMSISKRVWEEVRMLRNVVVAPQH